MLPVFDGEPRFRSVSKHLEVLPRLASSLSNLRNHLAQILCSKQVEDMLDGMIGLVVGSFDFAGRRLESLVGAVMK
jgi:hypothetical protein